MVPMGQLVELNLYLTYLDPDNTENLIIKNISSGHFNKFLRFDPGSITEFYGRVYTF